MDTKATTDQAGIPTACTLDTESAISQKLEWAQLHQHATAVTALDAGVRMTFAASMTDDIEDLAERERRCCSFLSITTYSQNDALALEVTSSDPNVVPLISALAGIDSL